MTNKAKISTSIRLSREVHSLVVKRAKSDDRSFNYTVENLLLIALNSDAQKASAPKSKPSNPHKDAPNNLPESGLYIDKDGMIRDVNVIDDDQLEASAPIPAPKKDYIQLPRGGYSLFGGEFLYDPETKQLTYLENDTTMHMETLEDALQMLRSAGW